MLTSLSDSTGRLKSLGVAICTSLDVSKRSSFMDVSTCGHQHKHNRYLNGKFQIQQNNFTCIRKVMYMHSHRKILYQVIYNPYMLLRPNCTNGKKETSTKLNYLQIFHWQNCIPITIHTISSFSYTSENDYFHQGLQRENSFQCYGNSVYYQE